MNYSATMILVMIFLFIIIGIGCGSHQTAWRISLLLTRRYLSFVDFVFMLLEIIKLQHVLLVDDKITLPIGVKQTLLEEIVDLSLDKVVTIDFLLHVEELFMQVIILLKLCLYLKLPPACILLVFLHLLLSTTSFG